MIRRKNRNGKIDREYHEWQIAEAQDALGALEDLMNGEPGVSLTDGQLGWLRAQVLGPIEIEEMALGLPHSPISRLRVDNATR